MASKKYSDEGFRKLGSGLKKATETFNLPTKPKNKDKKK